MALRSYAVPRLMVVDSYGTELADVRGINFADINLFLSMHFDDLDRLMAMWDHYHAISKREDMGALMQDADFAAFLVDVVSKAPGLIVDLIAIGADANTEEDKAAISKWPMHAQVNAAAKIYDLTVVDFGGPKKLIGAFLKQLRMYAPTAGILPA